MTIFIINLPKKAKLNNFENIEIVLFIEILTVQYNVDNIQTQSNK